MQQSTDKENSSGLRQSFSEIIEQWKQFTYMMSINHVCQNQYKTQLVLLISHLSNNSY